MDFHEKSLELNITHELLNLADSWYWFLTDIPLWRYWRPRNRLPFLKSPKSTAAGFHITTEGKDDSTGEKGGGFDVRIKSGLGSHLLFIQYKRGEFTSAIPDAKSEFAKLPHEHFTFEINGTKTNQHFVLRNLANGIGSIGKNAVVYGLPLIKDMDDMEKNAGKLIRKTKFISIADIDSQAAANKVKFQKGKKHNFRICEKDMNRCEVNFFFFFFHGKDRSPEIISDILAIKFEKNLRYFLKQIEENYKDYNLYSGYIPSGLERAFLQYSRYLLHHFEVKPASIVNYDFSPQDFFPSKEFEDYENTEHDVEILNATINALLKYYAYFQRLKRNPELLFTEEIPVHKSNILFQYNNEFLMKINDKNEDSIITDLNYLVI